MNFLKALFSFVIACLLFGAVAYLVLVGGAFIAAMAGGLAAVGTTIVVIGGLAALIYIYFTEDD